MPGLLDIIAARNPEQAGGLLSDLTAGPRNRLRGLLDDPGAFLQSALSDVVPTDQQAQEQLARYRMPASQAYAMGPSEYDNKMRDIALGALTVYHGSPHKFDKFDMSKIGTGEGAQAYGHGLYFTDTQDVARTYSADRAYVGAAMRGKPATINYEDPKWIAQKTIDELGDATKAKAHLEMVARTAAKNMTPESAAAVNGAIDLIASGGVSTKGNLYKVDIPDESIAKMLDWDKPLSQQAPEVRAALESHQAYPAIKAWLNAHLSNAPKGTEATGQAINEVLAGKLGGQQAVSNLLKSQGIPGIRYLDGGSRNAGQGTYNYVVFDDTLPTILERNGQKLK